jgi:phospholipase/carboxylesterase
LDINKNGFPKSKIFLLGFSQGACLAMEFIIRQKFSIGGIIPIAGFIGKKDKFKNSIVDGSQNTPVLLIHGRKDEMVLPVESKIALKLLLDAGYEVKLETLSVGHKIPLQAKGFIKSFINKVNLNS